MRLKGRSADDMQIAPGCHTNSQVPKYIHVTMSTARIFYFRENRTSVES